MSKNDKILIISVVLVATFTLILLKITSSTSKIANVYYENEIILKIDLSLPEQEYIVKGYNGDVKIKAGNNKIKVISETSEKHLCSKQGYITESYETIICLPNKIVIKIASESELDATL